ncbi:MAG: aldehyde ferredoxin oxidoreductase family protein [Candidatus Brockarchaeota archaeon]|nr:aldehyde ferredoxin oxidoreductase family protein [Candidatus Brockarchaeota archaeon]
MKGRGYAGKILRLDLPEARCSVEDLEEGEARLFLGGKGLGARMLYGNLEPRVDPLSGGNILIFATSPLTGTIAPTGNRFCVVTKSPLTGTFLDSHCGGSFGVGLKEAGFDAIAISGAAEELSLLVLEDGKASLVGARNLEGMTTLETEKRVKEELGAGFKVACIGPAGERGALIAGIFSDMRAAGRGGAGAVMGSKRLKAIAARGKERVRVSDPEAFEKAAWRAHRMVRMHEVTARHLPTYGSDNILETINETGALPTRNFQEGTFESASEISGAEWRKELWVRDSGCMMCPISCAKVAKVEGGPSGASFTEGPDYESIWALGALCGVSDKGAIARANLLCDLYGIDTISAGNAVAYAMECRERGLLKEEEVGNLDLRFGNGGAMLGLVEKVSRGEGLGKLLQSGVKRASEKLCEEKGDRAFLRLAMHVKGLELPGYDPRAAQGMGLGYATSDRGGCHLRGYTAGQELLGYGGGSNPRRTEGKARLVIERQNEKAVVDSSGICFYAFFAMTLKEVRAMLEAATGFEYGSERNLEKVGERIYNLTRLFNVREGFRSEDDALPERLLGEPMPSGPAKGMVANLGPMLKEYYRLRGWDEEGVPTKEKLEELGLA